MSLHESATWASKSFAQPVIRSTGKTTASHDENATWTPTSLAQPITRSTGKTTVSHVRNKISVDLSREVFNRAAMLIPPEEHVLFTSA